MSFFQMGRNPMQQPMQGQPMQQNQAMPQQQFQPQQFMPRQHFGGFFGGGEGGFGSFGRGRGGLWNHFQQGGEGEQGRHNQGFFQNGWGQRPQSFY